MADVFVKKITGMACYPDEGGLADVVFQVYWNLEGTDGTYTTAMSGVTEVPGPDAQNFIPYAQLTEPTVMGWVNQYTDPAIWTDYEAKMSEWLAAQHHPPVVNPPLPWSQTQAEQP